VLVRLDDREAQAQLRELRARENFYKRELSRVTELSSRGAATTQSFERATMDLNQIQALIAVQSEKISEYAIVAPMDGVVLRRDGEIGEMADIGQVLFRVGVPRPLQVVAEVNEEDIPRVSVGQKALLRTDAFPNRPLDAAVREITPMGDPNAKTYRIRLSLPDTTPLLPGMSVEANVIAQEKPGVLIVPSNALQGNTLYVIDGGLARARKVEVGIRGTRQAEIVSGLKEGETVASPAAAALKDGVRVRAALPAKP
jgi:RND family efflux transporter MFP subunit